MKIIERNQKTYPWMAKWRCTNCTSIIQFDENDVALFEPKPEKPYVGNFAAVEFMYLRGPEQTDFRGEIEGYGPAQINGKCPVCGKSTTFRKVER